MEEQDKDKDSQEINYFPQDPDSNQILLHTNNRTIKPVESQLITQQTLNQQVQSNQQQDIQKAQVDSFNYNIFNQKAYNQDNANQADHQFSVMHQSFLTSGRGTFGIVQIIADFQSGQLRAQKQFQLLEHYQKEAQIYKNMNNDFGDEQRELLALSIQPDEYNEQKQTIYFQPGVCSLQQLLDEPNFQLTTDQAVHVFITLLEFILLMKEKGYCHSDIKPNNTQLVRAGKNTGQFVLKVIDFGALTKEKLQYTAFTREFFNNPKRNYDQQGYVIFNNMEERFKNEFYTVIRTMQSMLLGNADKPIFKLENYQDQEIKLQNLKQIQQIINEKYQNQQQHNINDILTFITDQGLEEQYSFQDLQIILQRLKTNLTIEQKYFHDTQNTIRNIMDKQLIRINQRTDPIALLFGVNNYIYQMGSYSELHTNQFNLIDHFKQKFQELAVHKRSIVIIGESGAGKTLLLIKLRKELQQLENNYDIILINLKDLSDTNQDQQQKNQNLYDKISIYIKQQQKSKNNKNLIVLLDGYDELNDKQLNIHHQIIDNFKEYNQINIIVTMRPDYVNDTQLEQIFNKPIKIYICPFNKTQREEYVANFKKQFKKYKEFMLHSETLQTDNDYMQILEQSQQLDQLCARPFTLSLVVFMIPTLKQKMTEKKTQLTKYKIYKIFVNDYQKKRITNLCKIDDYQIIFTKKYGQQQFHASLKIDQKIFNQKSSWQMLKEEKLVLSQDSLRAVLNEVQTIYDIKIKDIVNLIKQISPTVVNDSNLFTYIHKSFYEFYIAQSIIEETLNAKCQAIDENKTMINTAFLRFDLEILTLVSEHVMEMPLQIQYILFFETWYSSILLTKKIKDYKLKDQQVPIDVI